MKFSLYIFLSYMLASCHVTVHAPQIGHPKRSIDSISTQLTLHIQDTSDLEIQVVHNPQYPTTYGIKLINKDTIHSLKIQKVKLGNAEKIYLDNCQLKESELGGIFEFCVIKPQYDSIFALEVLDTMPLKFKCEVYYTINQVKKVNYAAVIETISCVIGFTSGIAPKSENAPCIWAIGWGQ